MAYAEGDLLPLSGLQHLLYCERQAILIHVERVWADNIWTVDGTQGHETVTSGRHEARGELRISRALSLRGLRLGVMGRADVVEFRRIDDDSYGGARILGWRGRWQVYPVEYKRGRPKQHRADEVQLCAQALCLEEMLEVEIAEGALFYGQTRRREVVVLDEELRAVTETATRRFHELFNARVTPPAVYEKRRCDECSLFEICRPKASDRRVDQYLREVLREA